MPALPRNTYKTPHGFQFRLVVPEDLRQLIGKREIKKSLGKDYTTAARQAKLLAVQVDRQLDEARAKISTTREEQKGLEAYLATPVNKRPKPITQVTPELVEGLKGLWLSSLDADLAWRRQGVDDEEFEALQDNIATLQKALADALARGRPDPFIPAVHQMLAGRGYDLMVSEEDQRQLVLEVLPAIQEGYDLLTQRQQGRIVEPAQPVRAILPAVWETKPKKPDCAQAWQELYDHWKADRSRTKRTEFETETYLKHIQALFPNLTPAEFTRAHVTEWLRHERDSHGNAPGTLEKKGTLIGAMFSVALKDDLLERNPFAQFDYKRFAAKTGSENPEEREPFTSKQLKLIFDAHAGLPSIDKVSGGGGYHCRCWVPLMGLYSGARIDELCSLTVNDVFTDPVPHFRIRAGKNQSSVRTIPIHPRLVELGLLDYLAALRTAGHDRLWPELKTGSKIGDPSEVLGKWFNRFIHAKLGLPSTVVFHSFRHTFKDLCRNSGIPRDVHQALTGHASETVGDDYGKGYSVEFLHQELTKIVLDLNLTPPKPFQKTRLSGNDRASRSPGP